MRILSKPASLKSLLAMTTAFVLSPAVTGQAQSYQSYPDVVVQTTGVQPSYGSAQSLPDLSADAIAADVVSKFDPLSGRTEYLAQDFDPFEQDNQIAGTARLRSASSGMTRDGASVVGGAYLDLTVVYTSESRDPWDGKRLEHGVYMNGQPADYMSYDIQALDCQRDVTYVSYDDSYYRGASYGYLGGLYRPFPRYRGSSRYSRECDRIRYGNWRGLRNNYTNYSGYDRRWSSDRRLESEIRENIREIVTGEEGSYIDGDFDSRSDRDNVQERDLIMRLRDQQSISSYNVVSPDRLGDRRLDERAEDLSNQPIARRQGSISTSRYSTKPAQSARRVRELEQIRETGAAAGVPRLSNAVPRLSSPRIAVPNQSREITPPVRRAAPSERSRRRTTRAPRTEAPRVQAPRAAAPTVQAPRAQARTQAPTRSKPAPSAASERRAKPSVPRSTRSNERAAPKPNRSSSNRSSDRSSNRSSSSRRSSSKPSSTRSMNRSFGDRMRSPSPRNRRYYSGGSYADRYEQTRCIKEERITLHISEDRLLAARFDGLSIALLDQHGQDIPVYIPPNYVEGFIKANPYIGQYGSTSAPGYYPANPSR